MPSELKDKPQNETKEITMENKNLVTTKPPVKTSSQSDALDNVANGYGFACFWKNVNFGYRPSSLLLELTKTHKVQSFVEFVPHTVRQSIQLACNDSSFKKHKYNDEKVEARLVFEDETNKLFTIEFLGYEKVEEKKGKRTQVDRVVVEMDKGTIVDSGKTDLAKSWLSGFQKHLDNWSGNDVYTNVIKPYLNHMKAFRLSTSNYYVMNNEANQAYLSELRSFLEAIDYKFFTLTQAKDGFTQQALTSQVEDMLGSRINEVNEKVQEWRTKNRVHGRSENAVMTELSSILVDAQELEKNLETDLKDLRAKLESITNEAEDILNGQAPSGINPAIYGYWKSKLVEENAIAVTDAGMKFIVTLEEENKESMLVGEKLKTEVSKILKELGYYGFAFDGMVIVNPLKELETISI